MGSLLFLAVGGKKTRIRDGGNQECYTHSMKKVEKELVGKKDKGPRKGNLKVGP